MNFIDNRSKGGGSTMKPPYIRPYCTRNEFNLGKLRHHQDMAPGASWLRPCSRDLVGAAEDQTQASRMRDKDSTTKLLLLT